MGRVEICGQGVAASCCGYLLQGAGFEVSRVRRVRAAVPAIVVSAATEALLADVFQRGDLFQGCRRMDRRIVAWGPGAAPVTLPHAAVTIAEQALVERIEPQLEQEGGQSAEWTVFAARPLPPAAVERAFGSRHAWAVEVDLKAEAPACWVESLESGWLFLIPGWLLAVGGAPEALLKESRLVAEQIRGWRGGAEFAAYPRIAEALCGPGWLACGSAAMGFDPICGDGTGNAVREAILAAAVIRAAERGEPVQGLLQHYRRRLLAGFQRHLELSLEFYRRGRSGPWWDVEIEALERGIAWCAGELAAGPGFRYRLEGFELRAITE